MKKKNIGFAVCTMVLACFVMLSFVACGGGSTLEINYDTLSLKSGVNASLKLYDEFDEQIVDGITWTSSNVEVATVNDYGIVTGVAGGTAVITGSTDDGSATCTVTVADTVSASTTATEIIAGKTVGESTATVTLSKNGSAITSGVTWKSSDSAVATVSTTGVVAGLKAGEVTITGTCDGSDSSVTITVVDSVTYIFDGAEEVIAKQTVNIGYPATYYLYEDSDKVTDAVWSSSNATYATVSNGEVTVLEAGAGEEVVITATYNSQSYTFTVLILASNQHIEVGTQEVIENLTSGYEVGKYYLTNAATSTETMSLKDGLFTFTATIDDSTTSTGSALMMRFIPAAMDGTQWIGGKYSVTWTMTNNTEKEMSINANRNGDTGTSLGSWQTLAAGATHTYSLEVSNTDVHDEAADVKRHFNIKFYGYGKGTVEISNLITTLIGS